MSATTEIHTTPIDLIAEDKVNAYVNLPTGTGSPEQAVAALVREAVAVGVEYLRCGTEHTSITGSHNDELYGRALGLARAVEIATQGKITEDDVIGTVRVCYVEEIA